MSSWVGLFAAVWFARDAHRIDEIGRRKRDQQHSQGAALHPPELTTWKRWASRDAIPRVCTVASNRRVAEEHADADADADADVATGPAGPVGVGGVECPGDASESGWERVDLFSARPGRTGSLFDQTVALPTYAPDALDATIRTLVLRLRALPELVDLGRPAPYRLRLERTLAEAICARARLRDGHSASARSVPHPSL
jgi:hypothetical protein